MNTSLVIALISETYRINGFIYIPYRLYFSHVPLYKIYTALIFPKERYNRT